MHADSSSVSRRYLDRQGRYLEGQGSLEPPFAAGEIEILVGFLERQRATFAWKCSGLNAAGLATAFAGSEMTLGGMLKHLARFEDDMSTEWLTGEAQLPPWSAVDWETEHDWDWRTAAEASPEALYALWQNAVIRARIRFESAVLAGHQHRSAALPSIPYILLNMIEEYARHNGHADLIRESIDGLVGHDPPA